MIQDIEINGTPDLVKVITPPSFITLKPNRTSIFLGGSIEMDKAELWQQRFIDEFIKEIKERGIPVGKRFDILNPRRANWDLTVKQSIEDPVFYQQVRWELDYLEEVNFRLFYFAPNTLSPISLLEYGKFFDYPNTFICVHPDYQRRGNLEVFCNKYKIPIDTTFKNIIWSLKW